MERSGPVVVLACLVLVLSVGAVPTMVGSVGSSPEASTVTASPPVTTSPPVSAWSPVSASPSVAASPPVQANNTTARLTLSDYRVTQSGFETVRIGMGSALQTGSDSVRFQHHRIVVEQRFEAAGSIDEKRTVIDRTLIDLTDRSKALAARERALVRNYSDGSITGETLVRELARIDASAREIETTLDVLRDRADSNGINVFDGRIIGVRFWVESLQGPVRHRATRAMAGEMPSTRISVVTSDTGVVLSALIEDTYVREATDYRFRRLDDPNAVVSARDRAAELYPWAWTNRNYGGVDGALTVNIYRISVTHPQGELVAYMDTGSADVFREVQTFAVEDMPATSTFNLTGSGLRVALHRTHEGGPLDVYVEDATTGAVVNAEVTVGSHVLGRTGTDGHVRTLEPVGTYTINVSTNDSSFSATVDRDESEG